MRQNLALAVRAAVILLATLAAIFWMLFAFAEYPWIVPPDHVVSLVEARERSAAAGAALCILSLGTISTTAGYVGRSRRSALIAGAGIAAAHVALSPWLYSGLDTPLDGPVRLVVQVLGILSAIIGPWATCESRAK
ncbi:MAG: hypothetical protein WD069_16330 [Planctomycetales bacterium]